MQRLKNLWELSKFQPTSDPKLDTNEMVVRQQVFEKKQQRLATIVEDKPDLFADD